MIYQIAFQSVVQVTTPVSIARRHPCQPGLKNFGHHYKFCSARWFLSVKILWTKASISRPRPFTWPRLSKVQRNSFEISHETRRLDIQYSLYQRMNPELLLYCVVWNTKIGNLNFLHLQKGNISSCPLEKFWKELNGKSIQLDISRAAYATANQIISSLLLVLGEEL
jgi:hypothetical protein